MTRDEFELLYAIKKHGIQDACGMHRLAGVSLDDAPQALATLQEKDLVDGSGITEAGIAALAPHKVDNAVIMAAGMSTRFMPLSLERPKGLLVVRGEVLIERQIEQLQAAGIHDIILVLGYKKEAFFYLEDRYEGIHIVINPEYHTKNNTHTLYLARRHIGNSYVCSSDNYFAENPFEEYVYRSYYAAVHVHERTNEWYMVPDAGMCIARVEKSGEDGYIMLGHTYWDRSFSAAMTTILSENHGIGTYDGMLWEDVLALNLTRLPPMEIKVYPNDVIFEFDSLDELRSFDANYVSHTQSKIIRNIAGYFGCRESDVLGFQAINEGLTNTSFVFEVHGERFVYRHPGEGTEAIISRPHEKRALELAKSIGVDPTFMFMNDEEGWKISHYVEGIRVPSYDSRDDSRRVISVLRELHGRRLSADWEFLPWDEACRLEDLLRNEKGGIADQEFDALKADVERCYRRTVADGVEMRFCHCDTYAPNWMLTDRGDTILIDWEYAGNADPGCDTGTYIMDSMWEVDEAERFIREYCGDSFDETQLFHHLAYTAILSYYWYVWALYREACGAVMGESLHNWHVMARRYSRYLVREFAEDGGDLPRHYVDGTSL